ncbi:hypothetical protein GCK72_012113 [Caenorhabditis remanei]|uniref:MATH domain-containing protein n=1 Tax=Caenorhabditis remanei TaxID=31234 RepID=A0A6A5GM10_CAERE|nr:hypothetical protein GCK72_012113 [Caenorhabditis remanei]KAF1755663.1 hypothetical protein GCK72_012113 [Caenorhabditis remanei]
MGANQSHRDAEEHEDSEDSEDYQCSYLEDYPNPLGRFKSSFIINGIREKIENRHKDPTILTTRCRRGKIGLSYSISMPINDTRLKFHVYCKAYNVSQDWTVKGEVLCIFHNWQNEEEDSVVLTDAVFEKKSGRIPHRVISEMTYDELLNEDNGFVKNDSIWVEVDFEVEEVIGFYRPMVFNWRQEAETEKKGLELELRHFNESFYCSKEILSFHTESTKYLEIGMEIRDDYCFPLDTFLDVVHGFPVFGNGRCFTQISYMAHTYRAPNVLKRMETQAMRRPKHHMRTNDAIKYNWRRVVHTWLASLEKIEKADFEKLDIEMMSGEIMKAIVKRIVYLSDHSY